MNILPQQPENIPPASTISSEGLPADFKRQLREALVKTFAPLQISLSEAVVQANLCLESLRKLVQSRGEIVAQTDILLHKLDHLCESTGHMRTRTRQFSERLRNETREINALTTRFYNTMPQSAADDRLMPLIPSGARVPPRHFPTTVTQLAHMTGPQLTHVLKAFHENVPNKVEDRRKALRRLIIGG